MVTTLLVIGLIILLVINILLIRSLNIQFKKIKLYESWIVEYDDWVGSVRNLVKTTYIKMKNLDNNDVFFKDDEVGVVFTDLLDLLKHLNDKIGK